MSQDIFTVLNRFGAFQREDVIILNTYVPDVRHAATFKRSHSTIRYKVRRIFDVLLCIVRDPCNKIVEYHHSVPYDYTTPVVDALHPCADLECVIEMHCRVPAPPRVPCFLDLVGDEARPDATGGEVAGFPRRRQRGELSEANAAALTVNYGEKERCQLKRYGD